MGNLQVTLGQVIEREDNEKVNVSEKIEQVPGFSIHDNTEKEEKNDGERIKRKKDTEQEEKSDGKRRKRKKLTSFTSIASGESSRKGSLDVLSISRHKQHECRKSDRMGCYTTKYDFKTKARKYLPENKLGLKYLKRIRHYDGFNVFNGFVDKVNWQIMDHSLNAILQWIIQNKGLLCGADVGEKTSVKDIPIDFVCMRSVLTEIMKIPYFDLKKQKVWGIGAVKFGRAIYLISLTPDTFFRGKHNQKMTYSGQKFSEYITVPVNKDTHNEFREGLRDAVCYDFSCVFLNKSLEHNVLYAGKIDCIDYSTKNRDLKDMKFKELKILKVPDPSLNTVNRILSQRVKDMWLKAALSNVDQCVLGLRENNIHHIVGKIREVSVQNLLSLDPNWSPHHCVNSLNDVLDKIREAVKEERVYHRIYFTDPNTISIVRTSDSIDTILPPWFIKEERPQI